MERRSVLDNGISCVGGFLLFSLSRTSVPEAIPLGRVQHISGLSGSHHASSDPGVGAPKLRLLFLHVHLRGVANYCVQRLIL